MKALRLGILIVSLAGETTLAQQPSNTPVFTRPEDKTPALTLTVNVVERTTKAINYRHRGGATTVDFRGTPLQPIPAVKPRSRVNRDTSKLKSSSMDLQPASRFGPEYLTYVLWAITPEGRATNLGEVILNGTRAN